MYDGIASTHAVVNQPKSVERGVHVALLVDLLLLRTVGDDEDQEGDAVRKGIAEAKPLGKLRAKASPLRVICDETLWRQARK